MKKLMTYFGVAGFIGSCIGTIFIFWYFGRGGKEHLDEAVNIVLNLPHVGYLFAIPIVGTLSSVLWTLAYDPNKFGGWEGLKVSIFSYLSICALVSMFGGIYMPVNFFTFAFFGFVLFGWALAILGLYTGFLFRRNAYGAAL